jgi:1-acyl-sn-glycerol-3-phosphate acyltransferase
MWKIRIYTFLTVSAFGILYLFTGILVIIGMPFVFLRLKGAVIFIMRFWAKSVFLIIGKKLHIEGQENIKKNGKYILVANHSSLFDIIAIISFFPGVSWFGHARLLKIPVFRQVLKMTDYVPMKKANIKNTKEMIDRLIEKSKGHTIAIFPEGTRTLDGKVSEFYRGFIHVLRASEINVLPVTLNGFFVLKPKNRFYINFSSRISVIIHGPLLREALIDMDDAEIINIIKNIIESSLESYQLPENSRYSIQMP